MPLLSLRAARSISSKCVGGAKSSSCGGKNPDPGWVTGRYSHSREKYASRFSPNGPAMTCTAEHSPFIMKNLYS